MREKISSKFQDLVKTGQVLSRKLPTDSDGEPAYWVRGNDVPQCQAWLVSVLNLIERVALPTSYYVEALRKTLVEDQLKTGIQSASIIKVIGVLQSAEKEWEEGFLSEIEYLVAADTFDEFLNHADSYHKGNMKNEAGVLAGAVLEDTIKKIAERKQVDYKGKTLDPLVDDLVAASVFTRVKGKEMKSWATTRNHALHAEWNDFDIVDVGKLIKGVRELIKEYLQ